MNDDKEQTMIEVRVRSEASGQVLSGPPMCEVAPTRDAVLELWQLMKSWPWRDDLSELAGDELEVSLQFVNGGVSVFLEVVLLDSRE